MSLFLLNGATERSHFDEAKDTPVRIYFHYSEKSCPDFFVKGNPTLPWSSVNEKAVSRNHRMIKVAV
jgi:hypothetical protein